MSHSPAHPRASGDPGPEGQTGVSRALCKWNPPTHRRDLQTLGPRVRGDERRESESFGKAPLICNLSKRPVACP
jgi:hypothetical protein